MDPNTSPLIEDMVDLDLENDNQEWVPLPYMQPPKWDHFDADGQPFEENIVAENYYPIGQGSLLDEFFEDGVQPIIIDDISEPDEEPEYIDLVSDDDDDNDGSDYVESFSTRYFERLNLNERRHTSLRHNSDTNSDSYDSDTPIEIIEL